MARFGFAGVVEEASLDLPRVRKAKREDLTAGESLRWTVVGSGVVEAYGDGRQGEGEVREKGEAREEGVCGEGEKVAVVEVVAELMVERWSCEEEERLWWEVESLGNRVCTTGEGVGPAPSV